MAQIPHGPEDLKCPLWKLPMSEVCHTCPLWVQLRGVDKNTGEPIADEWMCSLRAMPTLMIENTQATNQAVASTDMMRNHFVEAVALRQLQKTIEPFLPKLIDHG